MFCDHRLLSASLLAKYYQKYTLYAVKYISSLYKDKMGGLGYFCIKNLPSNFKNLKNWMKGENLWDYRIWGLVTEGMMVPLLPSPQSNRAIIRAQSDSELWEEGCFTRLGPSVQGRLCHQPKLLQGKKTGGTNS